MSKNPAAVSLGRLGGSVKSAAKREAAKKRAEKQWERHREKQAKTGR